MADTSKDLLLPKGSTIFVTGSSGFIGSHVVNEALKLGYKVVGTTRSQDKAETCAKIFNNNPNYSSAIVPDMRKDGAFDDAMKNVDAVIHVASDTSFSPDPNEVIPPMIKGINDILTSAMKLPNVKSFVLTSSSTAATLPKPGKKFHIDKNMWNDEGVEMAWAPPPYKEERAFTVYGASKTEGERAFWKFVKENKPHFNTNAILPNFNMGTILSSPGATGQGVISTYQGNPPVWADPQYQIDVIDNARVHVIAAIDKTVDKERIFTFNRPFNWNDVLAAIRKIRPNAKLMDDIPDLGRDLSTVDNQLGADLLRKWYGQDGYKPMEQSIKDNLEGIE